MLWSLENIFEKYLLSFYESCTVDYSILEELKVRRFINQKGNLLSQLLYINYVVAIWIQTPSLANRNVLKMMYLKMLYHLSKHDNDVKKTLEKHIVLHNFCIRNTIFGLSHGLLNISLEGHALAWIIFIFKSILLRNMIDCPSYYAFEMLFRWSSIN